MADETSTGPRLCQHNFDERPTGESSKDVKSPPKCYPCPHPYSHIPDYYGQTAGAKKYLQDVGWPMNGTAVCCGFDRCGHPGGESTCVIWRRQPETTGARNQIKTRPDLHNEKDLCLLRG